MRINKEVRRAITIMILSAVYTAVAFSQPLKPVVIHIAQPVVKLAPRPQAVAIVIRPVMSKPTTTVAAK